MCAIDLIEAPKDVIRGFFMVKSARVVREVVVQRTSGQVLLEAIDFVEEQDDRGLHKPLRVDD
jgi:hypothetical protein